MTPPSSSDGGDGDGGNGEPGRYHQGGSAAAALSPGVIPCSYALPSYLTYKCQTKLFSIFNLVRQSAKY